MIENHYLSTANYNYSICLNIVIRYYRSGYFLDPGMMKECVGVRGGACRVPVTGNHQLTLRFLVNDAAFIIDLFF